MRKRCEGPTAGPGSGGCAGELLPRRLLALRCNGSINTRLMSLSKEHGQLIPRKYGVPRNTCFSSSLAVTCFEIGFVGITVLTLGAARNGPIVANRPCTQTGETEG
jgi:hypothetical protein